jgi:hypothetical protein
MTIVRCSRLLASYRGSRCCPLLSIGRIVIVLVVLILAVILVVQGYPPEAITGPVLVLLAGAVAAADRLVGMGRTRPASVLTSL